MKIQLEKRENKIACTTDFYVWAIDSNHIANLLIKTSNLTEAEVVYEQYTDKVNTIQSVILKEHITGQNTLTPFEHISTTETAEGLCLSTFTFKNVEMDVKYMLEASQPGDEITPEMTASIEILTICIEGHNIFNLLSCEMIEEIEQFMLKYIY